MNKNLQYWSAPGINIFNLLWSNVFSLGQLENILLPVDDFQSSILYEADKSISVLNPWRLLSVRRPRVLSLFKIGSLEISVFLLALEKEVTSTKPVCKKPCSEPQGKSQGPAGLCKWMPHLVDCILQFLMTYFQLPHLQDSEKWRG